MRGTLVAPLPCMTRFRTFTWCALAAALGFSAGQLSPRLIEPSNGSAPVLAPRAPSERAPVRPPPQPAENTAPRAPAPSPKQELLPADPAPARAAALPAPAPVGPNASDAMASAPSAAAAAAPRSRPAATSETRRSLLSAFRFQGIGPHGGMKLGRVVPGTLPALLGLKTGDEIVSLNGYRLAEPSQALMAYARLPYIDDWVASVHRGGVATEIRYALR